MTKTRERNEAHPEGKGKILKRLSTGKTGGPNNFGRVAAFHRDDGAKRLHQLVDLRRNTPSNGIFERTEYEPNRSSRINYAGFRGGNKIGQDLPPLASGTALESPVSLFSRSRLSPPLWNKKKVSSCVPLSQANPRPRESLHLLHRRWRREGLRLGLRRLYLSLPRG